MINLSPKRTLSEREIEVIRLMCEELTHKQIADKLCISVRTVDRHRDNILKKTEAKNSIGIAIYAFKNKLVPLTVAFSAMFIDCL